MASLPPEIFLMICTQLANQRDFNTLFNCACSGKQFALPALSRIYRMHNVALVTNISDLVETEQQQVRLCKSWMGLWKAIIRSSLGKTLYPYCKYIRTLNLGELEELLKDLDSYSERFKTSVTLSLAYSYPDLQVARLFLQGAGVDVESKTILPSFGQSTLNVVETTNKIGEGIIRQTTILEELTGNVTNAALLQWIPQLSRLKNLNLWHGGSLVGAGKLVRAHCPFFRSLKFWSWRDHEADHQLAAFLRDLRPQSLESFEVFCYSAIGPESLQALDWHRESLSELILNQPKLEAYLALPILKGCTSIVSLSLQGYDPRSLNLEPEDDDVIPGIIAWLRGCKKLRALSFTYFTNAFAIITPILLDHSIPLTRLEVDVHPMLERKEFYHALAHKKSLKSLWLTGYAAEQGNEASEILLESLCKLVNLEDLSLKDVSDLFRNEDIMRLAKSLPKLESWWSSGALVGDVIWNDIASLKSLRKLDLFALSQFTPEGILSFISKLGPGNKGFSLGVLMADLAYDLSAEQISLIRERLAEKVDGKFEFSLLEEPSDNESSEEGDSD